MSDNGSSMMEFALIFPVNIRSLPPKGIDITIKMNEKERKALAKNHDVLEVKFLEAQIHVNPWKRQGVKLTGRLHAQLVQECIVTAQPLDNVIDEEIELILIPEDSRLAETINQHNHELLLDPDGLDTPDSFKGNEINVGAIVEEFFELAIDSYPRAVGVEFTEVELGNSDKDDKKPSPFAVLRNLKPL